MTAAHHGSSLVPGGVELAQVNIARLRAPINDTLLVDFVALLQPVNAAADAAPGFRWRLQDESGDATALLAFEWDADGSAVPPPPTSEDVRSIVQSD